MTGTSLADLKRALDAAEREIVGIKVRCKHKFGKIKSRWPEEEARRLAALRERAADLRWKLGLR